MIKCGLSPKASLAQGKQQGNTSINRNPLCQRKHAFDLDLNGNF